MTTIKLDKAFIDAVGSPIYNVWQQIGSDCENACAACGERMTNASALETCIDADRLVVLGGKAGKDADALVSKAIDAFGYTRVHRYLCRNIRLA